MLTYKAGIRTFPVKEYWNLSLDTPKNNATEVRDVAVACDGELRFSPS